MEDYRCSVKINASPSKLFDAIVTKKGLQGWWTSDCEMVDGKATLHFDSTYLVMQLDNIIEYDEVLWKCIDQYHKADDDSLKNNNEWKGSDLIFKIKKIDSDQSELQFTHRGLNRSLECFEICESKWDHYLKRSLKHYVETGMGETYQTSMNGVKPIVDQYYNQMEESIKKGSLDFDRLCFADHATFVSPIENYVSRKFIEPLYNQFVSGIENFKIKRQIVNNVFASTLIEYQTKLSPLKVEMCEWIEIKHGKIIEFRVYFDTVAWNKAIKSI